MSKFAVVFICLVVAGHETYAQTLAQTVHDPPMSECQNPESCADKSSDLVKILQRRVDVGEEMALPSAPNTEIDALEDAPWVDPHRADKHMQGVPPEDQHMENDRSQSEAAHMTKEMEDFPESEEQDEPSLVTGADDIEATDHKLMSQQMDGPNALLGGGNIMKAAQRREDASHVDEEETYIEESESHADDLDEEDDIEGNESHAADEEDDIEEMEPRSDDLIEEDDRKGSKLYDEDANHTTQLIASRHDWPWSHRRRRRVWTTVTKIWESQPVKTHHLPPALRSTVNHGIKLGNAASQAFDQGMQWAAGAAQDAASWAAGVASDVSQWTAGAAKDAMQWTGSAGQSVAAWTGGAVSDIVQWSDGAVSDAGEWMKGAAEDVIEFAEAVGEFLIGLAMDAKEWVEKFLKKVWEGVKNTIKNALGSVGVCMGMKNFPHISANDIKNAPCIKTVTDVTTAIIRTVGNLGSFVNKLVSAVSNLLTDGDMYKAIFGMIGQKAVQAITNILKFDFNAFIRDLNVKKALQKLIQIVTRYWKKHAQSLAFELRSFMNELSKTIVSMSQTIKNAIEALIGSFALTQLSANSTAEEARRLKQHAALVEAYRGWSGRHWYMAMCGGGAAAIGTMGVCIYFPFVLGEVPDPRRITFEFGLGLQAEGGVDVEGAIKVGPLFQNDVSKLEGNAQSMGIDFDLGASGTAQFAMDLGFTWPDPKGPMISFDMQGGVGTGINKADAVSGASPGDVSPFWGSAFGFAPFKNMNFDIPCEVYFTCPDKVAFLTEASTYVNASDPMLDLPQVFANTSKAASKIAHNATMTSHTGKTLSSNSGLAEMNIDHKYAVVRGPCLPGMAITTASECKFAYNRLKPAFARASRRGLQNGHWNGVPWGCSIQYEGAFVNAHNDMSPHFNTYARTDNSRAVNGEFRTICRRGYRLHVEKQATCPPGSAIASSRECWDAYMELQGKFSHPPKRGLQKGHWAGVPQGCSIQYSGGFVSAHSDQSPHWNTYTASTGSRATSGEFRMLCKPQLFWLEDVYETSCPAGSIIDDKITCQNSYNVLRSRFPRPSQRGLVVGSFYGVPAACSVQLEGGYIKVQNDISPHLNSLATTNPYRSRSGEFRSMCGQPGYWMATTATCPKGSEIDNEFDCKAAYEFLRNEFYYVSKRGLVTGHWNGVPYGCSIQKSGSFVVANTDSSPHFNTYTNSDNSRSNTGEFRPLCMPGRYFMPKLKTTQCPSGTGISSVDECMKAYLSFSFKYVARRTLQKGTWAELPYQCSVQFQGGFTNHYKDQTPHFDTNAHAHGSRAASGEFRPICKVLF